MVFKSKTFLLLASVGPSLIKVPNAFTLVYCITHSASAQRREGDGFDPWPY